MDVKSVFFNDILNEKTYVVQPKESKDPHHMDHAYKLKKALYELNQASSTWYSRMTEYVLNISFKRREVDKTLFI